MIPKKILFIYLIGAAFLWTSSDNAFETPSAPDYAQSKFWAALPDKKDKADLVPENSIKDRQKEAKADVFFIHPTTYTKKRKLWNADLEEIEINERTDFGTIRHQASIFNGAGRVFAPRYRQAHIKAYYTKDKGSAKKALDLAYQDVKAAFEYYLEHYNDGRPIIIAAHSQGTTHSGPLLKAFFDGKPLQKKLIAAYLVGMPVQADQFENIKACETPEETGCFCTWRTYKKGYYPKRWYSKKNNIAVTNPLTWTTTEEFAPKTLNEGAVLAKFKEGFTKNLVSAKVHKGLLWVNKPKFKGSFLIMTKNYHIGDFNLFYLNVRKNAMLRTEKYLSKNEVVQ